MIIEIKNLTKMKIPKQLLEKAALDVFQKTKKKPLSVSVAIVGPKDAQALNKKYRNKSYIPNVLSFNYEEGGEIVLCPFIIRHDAKKYGIVFEQELVRVFTHGLFHILGYNHKQIEKLDRIFS